MYLYRHRVVGLKVRSEYPIDSDLYELIDTLPDPIDPESIDITDIEAITQAGGGYYDIEAPDGVITRVQGKAKALAEYQRVAGRA